MRYQKILMYFAPRASIFLAVVVEIVLRGLSTFQPEFTPPAAGIMKKSYYLRGLVSLRTYLRLFTHTQLMPILETGEETTLVGGQAVMEGVMMRAPHSYCVAVRKPNGEIVTEQMPLPKISEKYKIFKYPVFRGVGTLFQAMSLGMKALKFSADVSLEEIQKEEKKKGKETKEVPSWVLAANLIFSLAMFIFMYKFIP